MSRVTGAARITSAWIFAGFFLILARPTIGLVLIGSTLAIGGLALRAWAAGSIDKGHALATRGPYALVRHPLYLGSFLVGLGVSSAGGHWAWPMAFIAYFAVVYVPTVRAEEEVLAREYGQSFTEYAAGVPAFLPSPTPWPSGERASRPDFSWDRFMRYREWEASLGTAAMLAALVLKVLLAT